MANGWNSIKCWFPKQFQNSRIAFVVSENVCPGTAQTEKLRTAAANLRMKKKCKDSSQSLTCDHRFHFSPFLRFFKFDGRRCIDPSHISTVQYLHLQIGRHAVQHRPAILTGFCRATQDGVISFGQHYISVFVEDASRVRGRSRPQTGWRDADVSTSLTVEEYCPSHMGPAIASNWYVVLWHRYRPMQAKGNITHAVWFAAFFGQ